VEDHCLWTEVLDGPLKGERRQITHTGATLGRSPDNSVSISDPELSRRHSKIEYDKSDGRVSSSRRGGIVMMVVKYRDMTQQLSFPSSLCSLLVLFM